MASSAAYPGLIGPVTFKPHWGSHSKLHLWDGGLYDNAGMEVLFKPSEGLQKGIDRLYISDGGTKIDWAKKGWFRSLWRLVEIPMSQVRGLRSRIFIKHLIDNPGSGAYFQIGNTVTHIFKEAGINVESTILENSISEEEVESVANYPTTLRRITTEAFDSILKHGYQVSNATLHGFIGNPYSE